MIDHNSPIISKLSQLEGLAQGILRNPECDNVAEAGIAVDRAIAELKTIFSRTNDTEEEATLPSRARAARQEDAERGLPIRAPILDETLEETVFTHAGVRSDLNYDRLEVLGDAYIELVATRYLWKRYTDFPSGRISQIRENLVKNETLAEYAVMYGFDRRAKVPEEYLRNPKRWTKTKGDIFESYIAAAILSNPINGYKSVERWLTELWPPKLTGLDDANVSLQAKEALSKKIMGKGIKLKYIDEHAPIRQQGGQQLLFSIGVYLNGWGWTGRHLGSGKGSNKAIAGDQAARAALRNTSMIDEIRAVKESWEEGKKKEEERKIEKE